MKGKYALKRDEQIKAMRRELAMAQNKERMATENLETTQLALRVSRQSNYKLRCKVANLQRGFLFASVAATAALVFITRTYCMIG